MNLAMRTALFLAWATSFCPAGGAIDVGTMLSDMTDLGQLSRLPTPRFTTRQFSSYDRASKSPAENWFANDDHGQFIRQETVNGRTEWVMMEADGPGAIVRIWSANPKGTVRIYLDRSPAPVVETPLQTLLSGKFEGLAPPLACETSRGFNLYFPIPYARHCKVTCDQRDIYYHVNYRTYPAATTVQTFAADQIAAHRGLIERTRSALSAAAVRRELPAAETIASGETRELGRWSGPGAIDDIALKIESSADLEQATRSLVLTMRFDGALTVESPVGDFFGSGPGVNRFDSLPCGVDGDNVMWCRWKMPYAREATISLSNRGKAPAAVRRSIRAASEPWDERAMHFHARWRGEFDVATRPMRDWNFVEARGDGVFVGVVFSLDNPVKDWWGEGDEKIYVDGERFPSHFGTGTEDYFGYAWSSPRRFTHAYHNQTRCDGPVTYGRTSINRWHILDRIGFEKDFRFDMEIWHWKECRMNLAATAFWYARPGAADGFKPIADADVALRPMPAWTNPKVAGAIEGETMRIVAAPGTAAPQEWDGQSDGKQLWWRGGKTGDEMKLEFEAPAAGRYAVAGRFIRARDYGVIQLSINGARAGEAIDFYQPQVTPSAEMPLGEFELKQGTNTLTARIIGANARAVPDHMFGLDYLRLTPAK